MNLPQLSPPIERQSVGSPLRQPGLAQEESNDQRSLGARTPGGVEPSDVQDCYKLRGLAQNLCLAEY